jgi:hypothetical protein
MFGEFEDDLGELHSDNDAGESVVSVTRLTGAIDRRATAQRGPDRAFLVLAREYYAGIARCAIQVADRNK